MEVKVENGVIEGEVVEEVVIVKVVGVADKVNVVVVWPVVVGATEVGPEVVMV